jgi:hypothetical protein
MAIRKYAGDKITGLSSDTKPTNVSDGATFFETDTAKLYLKVSGSWTEVVSTLAVNAFDKANAANVLAFNTGIGANAWSNTKLSNSTGTFAGSLTVTGDLITQGNVTLGDASTDTITINGSAISLGNNQSIDSGTLFVDAVNNEVGIGTTNPTSNLHVIGTANVGRFIIDANGNAGLGTTNPKDNTKPVRFNLVPLSNAVSSVIFVTDNNAQSSKGGGSGSFISSYLSNDDIYNNWNAFHGAALRKKNGNIQSGLGFTNFSQAISTANSITYIGNFFGQTVSTGFNVNGIYNYISHNYVQKLNGVGSLANFYGYYSSLQTAVADETITNHYDFYAAPGEVSAGSVISNRYGLFINFGTANNITNAWGIYQNQSGVKNFFAGNVGIGTASPTSNLHVIGTANITSNLVVQGYDVIQTTTAAYDKANAANSLAFNTGIGANSFTSATIAGANSAVGAGANAYATSIGTASNTYLLNVIAGANTEVGTGANNYANATFVKLTAANQTITGNLSVVGSLTITGNTVFANTESLRISDPLLYLAGNNYTSDIVDIGFIANYVNSTGSNVHTGLYREHTSKEYYLFQEYNEEPNYNHIDPTANGFALSVLNAHIKTSNLALGGVNAIVWITSAYDKANAANVLAFNTGIGANAFTSATIAGTNTAVGTGANSYAATVGTSANSYLLTVIAGANTAVGTGANAFTSATIAGANTAVGTGANAYANLVWSRSNSFVTTTISGANTAVGAGANAFTSATIAGANTAVGSGANSYAATVGTSANAFTSATIAGANIAVGAGANSYAATVGTSANSYLLTVIAGANTAVGTGANAFTSVTISGANTAVGAGANAYANLVWSRSNSFVTTTISGANTAVGTGANAFTSATVAGANVISVAAFNKANAALPNTSGVTFTGNLIITGTLTGPNTSTKLDGFIIDCGTWS